MHKLTRNKSAWMPTVVETVPGIFSADPRKLLANEANVLGKFWEATPMPEPLEVLDINCFDRLTPDDIRAASR
eukprot:6110074-Pyramimonas_sp.AAC.1